MAITRSSVHPHSQSSQCPFRLPAAPPSCCQVNTQVNSQPGSIHSVPARPRQSVDTGWITREHCTVSPWTTTPCGYRGSLGLRMRFPTQQKYGCAAATLGHGRRSTEPSGRSRGPAASRLFSLYLNRPPSVFEIEPGVTNSASHIHPSNTGPRGDRLSQLLPAGTHLRNGNPNTKFHGKPTPKSLLTGAAVLP